MSAISAFTTHRPSSGTERVSGTTGEQDVNRRIPASETSAGLKTALRRVASRVHVDTPKRRLASADALETRGQNVPLDVRRRVHERAKTVPDQPPPRVFESHEGPDMTGIARIRERQHTPGELAGPFKQRDPIGIAADDAMHGYDFSRRNGVVDMHDIALQKTHSAGQAPAIRLGFRRVQVGRRGVYERGMASTTGKQLETENTNATADIQQ